MTLVLECGYEDGGHEYPKDWAFAGADGCDPRADPRWKPTTYAYFDTKLERIFITQTPLCDEEAIDQFTQVASFGPTYHPVWIAVKRPGEEKFTMLPVKYDELTDTAVDTA